MKRCNILFSLLVFLFNFPANALEYTSFCHSHHQSNKPKPITPLREELSNSQLRELYKLNATGLEFQSRKFKFVEFHEVAERKN